MKKANMAALAGSHVLTGFCNYHRPADQEAIEKFINAKVEKERQICIDNDDEASFDEAMERRYAEYSVPSSLKDADGVAFILDGKTYIAIEDPEDGYRSSMEDLFIDDSFEVSNKFPGQEVEVKFINHEQLEGCITHDKDYWDDYSQDDFFGLAIYDKITKSLVANIGTDFSDDYYPCFRGYFNPEALAINAPDYIDGQNVLDKYGVNSDDSDYKYTLGV